MDIINHRLFGDELSRQTARIHAAATRRIIQDEVNKWKWLVQLTNPDKVSCWHNQEIVSIMHQLHSVDFELTPPASPHQRNWTSYSDFFKFIYNVQEKTIFDPITAIGLLADEFIINPDWDLQRKIARRLQITGEFQSSELVLESLAKTDLLDDFMPMTQEWIEPEKCKSCGHLGAPKLGNSHNHKYPWFALPCPENNAQDKSLTSLFYKSFFTRMGGDGCENPNCEDPRGPPSVNKQRFQRPYLGFAIAVNRIRTREDTLVEVPIFSFILLC